MTVVKGDQIIEISSDNLLTVHQIWGRAVSKVIDFAAQYNFSIGIDQNDNDVIPSRGFAYEDEGVVWKRKA
ncbi:hypothetical protein EBB07_28435 [Paenibacillaceae bacterium]|nr:hypothetical protein EBB07_28435 [Paenibacillaceae bacterium]